MRLDPDTAEAVAIAAREWAEATTDLPLTIAKSSDGAVFVTRVKVRYTCAEFAELLGMSANTWRKNVKTHLGLTPASDGMYDAATVAWARDQLRQEEDRKTPHQLRMQRLRAESAG